MPQTSHLAINVSLLATALLFSPLSWSATAAIDNAKVTRTMVDSGAFGGCMALLSVNPKTRLPTCASGWVTFSCTGDFNEVVMGYQKLDQAKLALATGKSVYVLVDDSKKHNGYCFARRIDVR